MNIEAVNFLASAALPDLAPATGTAPGPTGAFSTWFAEQLGQANADLQRADLSLQSLAAGAAPNLHQVMIDMEQAKLSLQLVAQVRNHLLDAYRELMQMQM